jgi:D-amino-acid dehydrogenase
MSNKSQETVIVGGGVIGAMCAWYLTQAGERVTILDRDRFGAACSHGNCGYVSPSHVLPLTQPGMVRKALRSMLSSNSPFYVRPRLSLDLWSWLLKFARRCNERDMLEAADSIHRLLQSSRELYIDLIEKQKLECEWQPIGLLFVFHDAHEFHEYEPTNRLLDQKYGVSARPLDGAELTRFEPALVEGLGGAWYYDCDSHLRPDKLMSEMRRVLSNAGVKFVEECEVTGFRSTGFRSTGGRAVSVETKTHGEIAADRVVVACGALTPFLNQQLGCRIPIQPGKGYSLTMPRPAVCPTYPLIFEQHRVAITPMKSGYRIGSTMEFAGYDSRINQRRLQLLRDSARLYLREPDAEPLQETWYGWRPMTWDSKPYIDRSPRFDNVWVAAGHNMLGLSMATVTGKLIAEMMTGQQPHLDIRPLRIGR